MAGVETADCKFRTRDLSLLVGLLEPCDDPLFVELQLGLREFDWLVILSPHGDSEPDRDFFFFITPETNRTKSMKNHKSNQLEDYHFCFFFLFG